MLYPKLATTLRRLEVLLLISTFSLPSLTFADQAKKEVHSQADLPRLSYPFKGSISTLLQADDSTFDSATSKAAADIDSLLTEYDIQDQASLIGILSAKLSVQELKGDAAGGLERSEQAR